MPKTFTKNCCCHLPRSHVLVRKKDWKNARRRGSDMAIHCKKTLEEMFSAGYCVIPYIPLLAPVNPG